MYVGIKAGGGQITFLWLGPDVPHSLRCWDTAVWYWHMRNLVGWGIGQPGHGPILWLAEGLLHWQIFHGPVLLLIPFWQLQLR